MWRKLQSVAAGAGARLFKARWMNSAMSRRIGFIILIALGLFAAPMIYAIVGEVMPGASKTRVWLVHPLALRMLMLAVPLFIVILVVAGTILARNGRNLWAVATLSLPALIGFLILVLWSLAALHGRF
jgi:hypothetical protein